jgi:replicative DNA helicase
MDIKERIKEGLEGKYKGLANGFTRINNFIFGIQKKCYYLLGGQSGTYKTSLCDYMLINALLDAEKTGLSINVFYYSFEIDEITKKCNWLSNIAYLKYNTTISPEKIKGLGDFRLNEFEQKVIDKCIIDLDILWNKINFTFQSMNPTGIYNTLWNFMKERGTFEYSEYINQDGEKSKKIDRFIPNDTEEYNMVIIDHYFLLKKERGYMAKENVDKMSEYFVQLRNIFSMTIIAVQQLNQGISSVERQKFKGADLSVTQGDFKGSTNPYEDADVVLGTMNPAKMDMDECMGYEVGRLENLIMLKVVKNRLSNDNISVGLQANPKAGNFKELPSPNRIIYNDYIIN